MSHTDSRAQYLADRERRLSAALREVRAQIADIPAPLQVSERDSWAMSRITSGQPLGGILPRI